MDVVAVLTRVVQEQQRIVDGQQKTADQHERMARDQQQTIATLLARVEELERASDP
jgi:hypothetical protein